MAESDRELLEAAARVMFDGHRWNDRYECIEGWVNGDKTTMFWQPLIDDGHALRLAIRLNIPIFPYDDETSTGTLGVTVKNWGSKEANTRRAIVRAAVALAGKEAKP